MRNEFYRSTRIVQVLGESGSRWRWYHSGAARVPRWGKWCRESTEMERKWCRESTERELFSTLHQHPYPYEYFLYTTHLHLCLSSNTLTTYYKLIIVRPFCHLAPPNLSCFSTHIQSFNTSDITLRINHQIFPLLHIIYVGCNRA